MKPNLGDSDRSREKQSIERNGSERVKVYVRLRPFTEEEYAKDRQTCIESFDPESKSVVIKKELGGKTFTFDDLVDPKSDQEEVYKTLAQPVVQSVLNGYNGTIFAYGQTGTGKTYTILGDYEDEKAKGIIPRALEDIFLHTLINRGSKYEIQIAYLQIYMDMIQDLIEPSNSGIKVRESQENGVFLDGLSWVAVHSAADSLQVVASAEKNRITSFTNLNEVSSRSHTVLLVKICKRNPPTSVHSSKLSSLTPSEREAFRGGNTMITSVLYLVDLAGSERIKKSKVSGERLDEAISINSSLSVLGKCIHALGDSKRNFVPFRDSKLTRILQDSLGGNSKTSLIITIGPSIHHIDETMSSLLFGSRAMKVQNKPYISKQQDLSAYTQEIQNELENKQEEVEMMHEKVSEIVSELNELRREYEELKMHNYRIELSNENMRNSLNSAFGKEAYEAWEKSKKVEIEKLEAIYQERIQKQEEEHKNLLEEIDKMMIEQENEIRETKLKKDELAAQVQSLKAELANERDEKNLIISKMNSLNENIASKSVHLNQDNESLKARIKELEERLVNAEREHKKECAVLNSKVGEKEIIIKELQKNLSELNEREKLRESDYEKEKKLFEDKLVLKERELNRVQKEYKEEKRDLAQRIAAAEKYFMSLEALFDEEGSRNKENTSKVLERKLSEVEISKTAQIQDLKQQLSQKEAETTELSKTVKELKAIIAKTDQESANLLKTQKILEEAKARLEKDNEQLDKENKSLKQDLEGKEGHIGEITKSLESLKETLRKNEAVQFEKNELKAKTEDLEKTIKQENDHIARLRNSVKEKDRTISEFKIIIEALQSANQRLENQITDLKEQIEWSNAKLNEEIEVCSKLRESSTSTCKKVTEIQDELTATKKELNRQRIESLQLRGENESLVEKYAALEGEINRMLEQMSVAEIEFDKVLSQKQKELDDEKRKAQKFVKDMKADYDQERTKLQEERAQTNNQIKELQEALAETQRKLKAAIEKENESLMNSQREIQNMQQIYAMNSNPVVRSSRSEDHSSTCRCKNEENNKTKELVLLTERVQEAERREYNYLQEIDTLNKNLAELRSALQNQEESQHFEEQDALNEVAFELEKARKDNEHYKNIISHLREKLRILESDLKMIADAKQELENEKNAHIETLSQEICKLTLDNTLNAVENQTLHNEVDTLHNEVETLHNEVDALHNEIETLHKENQTLQKELATGPAPSLTDRSACSELKDFLNISTNVVRKGRPLEPGRLSRKWLKSVLHVQNQALDTQKFNGFVDMALRTHTDYIQATKTFNEFHNRSTTQLKRPPVTQNNYSLPPEEFEEVKNVLDNLLFIVEVEYEIESKVALDLSFVNIDHHLEGKLNKKVSKYNSPSKYCSTQSYRNIATPRKMTRLAEVPSTEIFAINYNSKLQRLAQSTFYNNVQSYIYCGSKALERLFDKEEGIEGNEKQLIVELSELVVNSYNYAAFLTNQSCLKDRIIKDMACMVEIFVGCMANKEIELKISEREKKLMLKRLVSTIRTHEFERREFAVASQEMNVMKLREQAALKIQRAFRAKQQQKYQKMLLLKSSYKRKKEQLKSMLLKQSMSQWKQNTGEMIVTQSKTKINQIFSNLLETFVDKQSGRYQKYKNLNLKKNSFHNVNSSKVSVKDFNSMYSSEDVEKEKTVVSCGPIPNLFFKRKAHF